jgi:hypothetical protein
VLPALRANKGWPRVIALVLLLVFSAGLLHVHATGASAEVAVAVAADAHDGHSHDHGGSTAPSVTSHCAFCAVVAGKFYMPAAIPAYRMVDGVRIAFLSSTFRLVSFPSADLFRPPIALAG